MPPQGCKALSSFLLKSECRGACAGAQGHAGLSQSCTWLMGVRYGHAIPRADSDATSPQAAAASSSLDSGSADQREALLGTRQVLTPEVRRR